MQQNRQQPLNQHHCTSEAFVRLKTSASINMSQWVSVFDWIHEPCELYECAAAAVFTPDRPCHNDNGINGSQGSGHHTIMLWNLGGLSRFCYFALASFDIFAFIWSIPIGLSFIRFKKISAKIIPTSCFTLTLSRCFAFSA
jgi:hypothetical protein